MPLPLITGTLLQCSFGVAPSVFVANPLPGAPLALGALACGTIDQIVPIMNIPPFGMCQSMANPQVAAATAAAMGALTPMPCMPVIPAPWVPPSINTFANAVPLATVASKCMCTWGGAISATPTAPDPAQVT